MQLLSEIKQIRVGTKMAYPMLTDVDKASRIQLKEWFYNLPDPANDWQKTIEKRIIHNLTKGV